VAAIYAPYVCGTAVSFEVEAPTDVIMAQRISATLNTHPWLVAEFDRAIIGFAYAGKHSQRAASRWTVDVTIYVSMRAQQSGVGRSLYRALLESLRRQGFRSGRCCRRGRRPPTLLSRQWRPSLSHWRWHRALSQQP
jgi:L-amino acid N-acyltransferase YncA